VWAFILYTGCPRKQAKQFRWRGAHLLSNIKILSTKSYRLY
jgi:hypothetical protein